MREVSHGRVAFLELLADEFNVRARVRVKTRRSGTWQTSVTEGAADPMPSDVPTFWAFVDMSVTPPRVYLADDVTVRKGIHEGHQPYLAKHGGRRAENQDSNHHAIKLDRVARWDKGWEALGLTRSPASDSDGKR